MSIHCDEFGYSNLDEINQDVMKIDEKEKRCNALKKYMYDNITAIRNAKNFSKKFDNNLVDKEPNISKNSVNNKSDEIKESNNINEIDVDYYYNMVINCQSAELDDLLLNVIIPNDVLYPILVRLQKEYVSYYKLQHQFEQEGDNSSVLDCQLEMYNIITIIDHIKNFDTIEDKDLDNLVESIPAVNNLVYLTNGDKILPYEDISKIPIEYYAGINKLITGMRYGKFNKIKSLYDRDLLQVSDGLRIRIYFRHIKDNNFLIAGVYLYTSNGKDKSSKIFIDKRDALSREFINKYDNENVNDDHAKVLELLNNRGGY